jgi:hypothetical protein
MRHVEVGRALVEVDADGEGDGHASVRPVPSKVVRYRPVGPRLIRARTPKGDGAGGNAVARRSGGT